MKWYAIAIIGVALAYALIAFAENQTPEVPPGCKMICESTK